MQNFQQIEKLQKITSNTFPIFSIFLKTDRKSEPFDKVKITLKNLLKKQEKNFESHSEKEYFKKISQKITDYIEQNIPQTRFHGVAIFAGGDDEIFEVIELNLIPKTIQDTLVLIKNPFLDIFDFYDKKFKKFAVIITNERQTKIYLAQGNDIIQVKEHKLDIERKTDREGVFRSKKGVSGGGTAENIKERETGLKRYFKEISVQLTQICQDEKINALIVSATAKSLPILEKELPKSLEKIITAKWTGDLTKIDEVSLLNKIKDFEKNI